VLLSPSGQEMPGQQAARSRLALHGATGTAPCSAARGIVRGGEGRGRAGGAPRKSVTRSDPRTSRFALLHVTSRLPVLLVVLIVLVVLVVLRLLLLLLLLVIVPLRNDAHLDGLGCPQLIH